MKTVLSTTCLPLSLTLALGAAALVGLPLTGPAMAQEAPYSPPAADDPGSDRGRDGRSSLEGTLQEGLNGLFENLLRDIEPHMDAIGRELGGAVQSLGPVFDDLGNMMDDAGNYQAPERLENGDILIRRRADAPPPPVVGEGLQNLLRPAPKRDPHAHRPIGTPRTAPLPPTDIPPQTGRSGDEIEL